MRLLLIKTSSLGDIVHALAAVTDAQRACRDLQVDWLVERAFAEIPAWHPAVGRVLQSDLRAWRRRPFASRHSPEWKALRQALQEPYDLVLDAQGLLKSAWLARCARGLRAGPDFHGAREPLASLFYQRRVPIPAHDEAHAIERMRRLFAGALGYPLPQTPADAGLARGRFPLPSAPPPYVVLLHGTSWTNKRWPLASWQRIGRWLQDHGRLVVLPWGSEEERVQAERIAQACGGQVLPRLSLGALAGWLAGAETFVGVDTGLSHLGAALGIPGLTLYGPTLPGLTGTRGAHQVHLGGEANGHIDRQRPTNVDPADVERALLRLLGLPEQAS